MAEDKENFYPEYDDATLLELATAQKAAKEEIEALGKEKTTWQKRFDHLRMVLIPEKMEEEGINKVDFDGIGRVTTEANLYASIIKDKKEEAYDWLRDNGHGDLINGTVNASSLKAFLKECMRNGEAFPDDLFKATPYMMAKITKG